MDWRRVTVASAMLDAGSHSRMLSSVAVSAVMVDFEIDVEPAKLEYCTLSRPKAARVASMLRWIYGASSESWLGLTLRACKIVGYSTPITIATKSHSPTATAGNDHPRMRTFASRISAAAIERKNRIVRAGIRA